MAGVYQVIVGSVDKAGNYWENVFHFNCDEFVGTDTWIIATDMANTWATALAPTYLDMLSADVTVNLLAAKKVSGVGGPTAFVSFAMPGNISAAMISPVMAADLAVFPGGLKNRNGHIFISGVPQTAFNNSAWDISWTPSAAAFATALLGLSLSNGGNVIGYGTYTKSTKTCTKANHIELVGKPTGMNKRTLPIV